MSLSMHTYYIGHIHYRRNYKLRVAYIILVIAGQPTKIIALIRMEAQICPLKQVNSNLSRHAKRLYLSHIILYDHNYNHICHNHNSYSYKDGS